MTSRLDRTILPGRYHATPRTVCFVTHGDSVLLLRGAPDKPLFAGRYNGVGGHVEADEDVHAAALREILEETGLVVDDLLLRGVVNVPSAEDTNQGVLLFVFRARALSRTFHPSAEGTLEWVTRDDVDALPLVEDLPLLLPSVLDAPPGAAPFFGHYAHDAEGRLTARFSQ